MAKIQPKRGKAKLTTDAKFDENLPIPCTVLELDGSPGKLECWHQAALMTEDLKSGDEIEFEYRGFWPHVIPDPENAVGTYVERNVLSALVSKSGSPPPPLKLTPHRTPPPQQAIWGPYEEMEYVKLLKQVRGA